MAYKFLLFLVAAVGAASLQDQHQTQSQQNREQSQLQQSVEWQLHQQQRYAANAQDQRGDDSVGYDFAYSVQDPITGDYKSQEESRRNGKVRGQFSWVDADGVRQIVDYRADDRNGFNSEHRREPATRPRLNRVLQVVPGSSLYTIDTVIAPVYTSASRYDHSYSRHQSNRDDRDDRDHQHDERHDREDRDGRENRDDRDHRDDRENREEHDSRDERDNRDNRDHRDNRDRQTEQDRRDDRNQRDGRDGRDGRENQNRSREGRRGREGHAQSEVRFQDPTVAYQYSN